MDVFLAERFDNVLTGFGLEETFEKIFTTTEIGLRSFGILRRARVEDGLFTFHQLETHIGRTEVATDADEVRVLRSVTINDVLFLGFTNTGDADGQTGD